MLLLAEFALPARVTAVEPVWGRTVVRIGLESDAHLNFADFAPQITLKVGEPLDRLQVEKSLKNLYATGRFVDLRAEVEEKGSGVELIFAARCQFFVGVVRVKGAPGPVGPRALVTATRLRLGQPVGEVEIVAAEQRLTQVLADNGYYHAQVNHQEFRNLDDFETEIDFSINPGRPAALGGVQFRGRTVLEPDRLAAVAGWRSGRQLTAARLERGMSRIHQFYLKRDRPQATAGTLKRTFNPGLNAEKLLVEVEAGPLVKTQVRGARISRSKLREALPLFQEGIADEAALERGRESLEDYFERKGYYSVVVKGDRKVRSSPPEIDFTYSVTLGTPGEFVGYDFHGNRSIPDEELASHLSLEPRSFLRDPGVFSRQLLERDIASLTSLFHSRGFLEARVTPRLNTNFENQPEHLFLTFQVEEGPRSMAGKLQLEGVDEKAEKEIEANLPLRPGQPYSPAGAETDRDSILAYFSDHGYRQATVDWTSSPPSPEREVNLEFHIHPGTREEIKRVEILGNEHTREKIVRREILFHPGEPVNQSSLLESQRRLYDHLGVFNQVQISMQDPKSAETEKTVLVGVEEAKRWTVGYGGGFEVQRLGGNQPQGQFRGAPRLSLDVSRLNVGGRDQTITLRGRVSNLETGGAINYFVPEFTGRHNLNLRLSALADRSRDVQTFTANRDETSASLERRYGASTLLVVRFGFRRVAVDGSSLRIAPNEIPLRSQPARIAMPDVSYVSDHRNDPADATRGSYSLADAGISWQGFGSQANFLRFSGQNATYYRLGAHLVFARETRLGVESPYGGLIEFHVPPSGTQPARVILTHDIPLPERFFMGGSESHRGFSINQAGPRDPVTGFPVGGNALFFNSFELRARFAENRLGLVLFHDSGNVYSSIRKLHLLKVTQSSPTDLDYTVHALGLGVRYKTPLGPIRFDIGYGLNPPRFQVQVPGGLEVQRISRIQFFFGIGQSF